MGSLAHPECLQEQLVLQTAALVLLRNSTGL